MQPVALGACRPGASPAAPGAAATGRSRPARRSSVFVERAQHRRLQRAQVVVERVDDQPERDVALELGRAAVQHEVAAVPAAAAQLGQQAATCRCPARRRSAPATAHRPPADRALPRSQLARGHVQPAACEPSRSPGSSSRLHRFSPTGGSQSGLRRSASPEPELVSGERERLTGARWGWPYPRPRATGAPSIRPAHAHEGSCAYAAWVARAVPARRLADPTAPRPSSRTSGDQPSRPAVAMTLAFCLSCGLRRRPRPCPGPVERPRRREAPAERSHAEPSSAEAAR